VSKQSSSRPVKSWAVGCEDYLAHVAKIKTDFKDVLETDAAGAKPTISAAPTPSAAAPTLFGSLATPTPMKDAPLFGAFAAAKKDDDASKPAPATPSLFSLGGGAAKASTAPSTAAPSLFPAAASNPFGGGGGGGGAGASTPSLFTPAPSGGGAGAGAAPPTFGGFGIPPATGGTPVGGGDGDDDDEPARPPSPSVAAKEKTEDDTEDTLLKVKCKFFTKKDAADAWGDHGVNHLEFLKEKVAVDGVKRARVVCRNSIGKAVMNAGVYANMGVQVVEKKAPDGSVKKNGIIVQLFNAVEESAKTITLFRLGKEDDVVALKKLFEQSVAEMK